MIINQCRRVVLLSLLMSLAVPMTVARAPWIDPGDRLIRRDIELLKAYGLIDGPISTWPMSWRQVERSLAAIENSAALPFHVQEAVRRLERQSVAEVDPNLAQLAVETEFTNEERLIRDFAGGARDEVDVRIIGDKLFSRAYARLSVGYRQDDFDEDFNFDGSVLGVTLGNWLIFGGLQDQWYGPGFDSALILSTNARPPPKISIQRLDPKRIDLPVLRWLGPVQLNFTTAFDESGREDFANPLLFFTRFSFEPIYGLQIGVSRGLQLCGEGRVCSAENIGRAFVTVVDFIFQVGGDLDNTGDLFSDPGNQVAGLDFRYTRTIGPLDVIGYAEVASEDSSGPVAIGDVSLTLGASVSGFWKKRSLAWTLRGEISDTFANRFFGIAGVPEEGSANSNFIFTDGYTFRDDFIGPSIGGDGQLITIEASAVDKRSWLYFLRYRNIQLNDSGLSPFPIAPFDLGRIAFNNIVSDNPESINQVELGIFSPPTRFGRFFAEARFADDEPNTPGESGFAGAFELGWTYRF